MIYFILFFVAWVLLGYLGWTFNKGYFVYKYLQFATSELEKNELLTDIIGGPVPFFVTIICIILWKIEDKDNKFYPPIFTISQIKKVIERQNKEYQFFYIKKDI
jgi:hypothetical protein